MTSLRLNFHPSISVSCRCPTCYRSIISHASYPPILASFPSLLFCSSSFLPLRAYNWLLPPCTSFSMIDHDYATNTTITILHHTHARIYFIYLYPLDDSYDITSYIAFINSGPITSTQIYLSFFVLSFLSFYYSFMVYYPTLFHSFTSLQIVSFARASMRM